MLKNALVGLAVMLAACSLGPAAIAQQSAPAAAQQVSMVIGLPNNVTVTLNALRSAMGTVRGAHPEVGIGLNSDGQVDIHGPKSEVEEAIRTFNRYFTDLQQADEEAAKQLEESTVTLKFPGGTVRDFVDAVLGKFHVVPPMYQSDDLRSLRMRPVEIRLMDVDAALSLLHRMPPTDAHGAPVPLSASWVGDSGMGTRNRQISRAARLQQMLCVISTDERARAPQTSMTRRAAFALTDGAPLPNEQVEALLDAISLAVNLDGDSTTFRAKYHAPSGLLIVRGTKDELGVTAQIIKSKLPKSRVQLPEMNDDAPTTSQDSAPESTASAPPEAAPPANSAAPQRKPNR